MRHHQAEQVRDDLASNQLVVFIGARGTGKTMLADELASEFASIDLDVVRIDIRHIDSLAAINAPLFALLGGGEGDVLSELQPPPDRRIRIIVDNCQDIYDADWMGEFQDEWRAFLTAPQMEGVVSALFLGRPLFRNVLGGRGSPLMNVAALRIAEPMSVQAVAGTFDIDLPFATAVNRKTGGHPDLTRRFIVAAENEIANMRTGVERILETEHRYLLSLVEDHTIAGIGLLADLLAAGAPVAEGTLVHMRFGSSYTAGLDVLGDLAGSGLIRKDGEQWEITADILRAVPQVTTFIRVPELQIPIDAPGEHGTAAACLYLLENTLRRLVADCLSSIESGWWPARIDEAVAGAAESRWKAERASRTAPQRETHPILYVNLGELFGVIERSDNWTQAFGLRLNMDREKYNDVRDDVLAVRNKVGHNRQITDDDMALCRAAAREFGVEC